MGFFAALFQFGILIAAFIGVLMAAIGLVLLLVYLIKRKKRKPLMVVSVLLMTVGVVFLGATMLMSSFLNRTAIDLYINPGTYPVVNAIARHDSRGLEEALARGADVNETFLDQRAIFWTVCLDYGPNVDAVRILLKNKVNLQAKSAAKNQSLMRYIITAPRKMGSDDDYCRIITLLLDHGYDPNETDADGVALLRLLESRHEGSGRSGYFDRIKKLLLDHGAQ